jgi:uncharacterized membrane protein YjjP (DUF1212 family)
VDVDEGNGDHTVEKVFSALAAQERAQRIATLVGSHSDPASRRTSVEDSIDDLDLSISRLPVRGEDIPLVNFGRSNYDETDYDSGDEDQEKQERLLRKSSSSEAHKLVTAHTRKNPSNGHGIRNDPSPGLVSGQATPVEEQGLEDYVARPAQYRGGILSSLLKLYNSSSPISHAHQEINSESMTSPLQTPPNGASGTTTPSKKNPKWYKQKHHSTDTLAGLIGASAILSAHAGVGTGAPPAKIKSGAKRAHSAGFIDSAIERISRPRLEDEIRITVHIAEILSRQKYLVRLCRALISYGAPTHRLEEYMKMSARVLEIDGQFFYIPGCMIISFDDAATHTTEVKLVRSTQGVHLGKLKDVHEIYKEVVHDVIGVEEATQRLDTITREKPKYNEWLRVLVYGLASATVGPFAFQARWIDLPISFVLGCILGILQLIIAPKSDLYSNVFEISAAVLTSFLARAFGSIWYKGDPLFCFSAMAQSAIALILPGYVVLCGSLELQSKSIVAGSVRMVYAVIVSMPLLLLFQVVCLLRSTRPLKQKHYRHINKFLHGSS